MRRVLAMAGLLLLCAGMSDGTGGGQMTPWPAPAGQQDTNHHAEPPDANRVRLQEEQAKRANDERQKRLMGDTAKLYELAGELKEEVAKSDKNTLSVDVVKKAEEIEKLARSVKDKMRG